jgi:hypothetical protein
MTKKVFEVDEVVVTIEQIYKPGGTVEEGSVGSVTEIKNNRQYGQAIRTTLHPSWWVGSKYYDRCDKDYIPYEDCEI